MITFLLARLRKWKQQVIVHEKILVSMGLQIRTWANVPRGSGLGTSSILAAAVVKGLLQISDGDESNENVAGHGKRTCANDRLVK